MNQRLDRLTAAELSSIYFGNTPNTATKPTTRAALTPTALFLAREVRKRISVNGAVGTDGTDEHEILSTLTSLEQEQHIQLSELERTAATHYVADSNDSYGPLTTLVRTPAISDILVRRFDDISFQVDRRNYRTDLRFPDDAAYRAFLELLLARCGRSCTTSTPVVDISPEPHLRMCVTHESFSPAGEGPTLTLRIHRHSSVTLERLAHEGLAPAPILWHLLALLCEANSTLVICGEVGTGKTTLARALASALPPSESVLTVEDTHELALQRPFARTLLTRERNTEGSGRITPAEAIRTGMRMAMNRLLLGEVRDAEAAEAFIDATSSGHAGLTTIHARSARDALLRFQLFLRRAQPNSDTASINGQLARSVGAIVHLALDQRSSNRRITEVLEVGDSGEGAIKIQPLVRFADSDSGPTWRKECSLSLHHKLLRASALLTAPRGSELRIVNDTEA